MSYLLLSLVPPIVDIDGISRRISQSELSQRFTPRFSWRRKYNQEWQVMADAGWMWWDVTLPVINPIPRRPRNYTSTPETKP